MLQKTYTLAKAALRPSRGPVMVKKVVKRLTDREASGRLKANMEWIRSHCGDFAAEAMTIDADLWQEALETSAKLERRARQELAEVGVDLGGGGFYPMLYFMTRLRRPRIVVETGVAAGFSSQMFLEALDVNGDEGRLYSSDFPYFRLEQPEQFIGLLVESRLRDRWQLFIDGDEKNLPKILGAVDRIDFFHYDSDKSRSGRAFAMDRVLPRMAEGGLVVMDDIQDNAYFHDLVRDRGAAFEIYRFEGKYIGVLKT